MFRLLGERYRLHGLAVKTKSIIYILRFADFVTEVRKLIFHFVGCRSQGNRTNVLITVFRLTAR